MKKKQLTYQKLERKYFTETMGMVLVTTDKICHNSSVIKAQMAGSRNNFRSKLPSIKTLAQKKTIIPKNTGSVGSEKENPKSLNSNHTERGVTKAIAAKNQGKLVMAKYATNTPPETRGKYKMSFNRHTTLVAKKSANKTIIHLGVVEEIKGYPSFCSRKRRIFSQITSIIRANTKLPTVEITTINQRTG